MTIDYEKNGRIARVTLNRPDAMNAINAKMFDRLGEVLADFRDDPEVWVAIVTGTGEKAFSAGADLKTVIPSRGERPKDAGPAPTASVYTGLNIMKPMIAAINGHCLAGALGLALICDIRIAAENATFGTMGVKRGIIPGGGQTQRLPRVIPLAKAFEMFFLAERIDAQEALRIGLVNAVVPLSEVMPTAERWAAKICENAPLAIRATKEVVLRGLELPLQDGLRLERELGHPLNFTEDVKEGLKAFAEKRPPQFKGR